MFFDALCRPCLVAPGVAVYLYVVHGLRISMDRLAAHVALDQTTVTRGCNTFAHACKGWDGFSHGGGGLSQQVPIQQILHRPTFHRHTLLLLTHQLRSPPAHAQRDKPLPSLLDSLPFQGIEPEDAVYLPAVETALSLVHDVHPRVGEKVAVFGQGMIG